jgi:hypothetical protein
MDMVYNWFFFIGLVWFSYKMDLVIKIGFGLVSILVMVNQIFCTPLLFGDCICCVLCVWMHL